MFELQPDIEWDKGKAVLWLLDKLVVPMAKAPTDEEAAAVVSAASSAVITPASAADATATMAAAAAAGGGSNGTGGGGGGGQDEDDEDESPDRFFTIFIGDDKTDEVRRAIACLGMSYDGGSLERDRTAPLSGVVTTLCVLESPFCAGQKCSGRHDGGNYPSWGGCIEGSRLGHARARSLHEDPLCCALRTSALLCVSWGVDPAVYSHCRDDSTNSEYP